MFPAPTRWMSIYIAYERIVSIHEHVNTVALKQGWPTIASKDIKLMETFLKLLKPLKDILLIWEQDGLTIASVFNGVQMLVAYYKVNKFKNV